MVLEVIYVVRHGYRSNWVVDASTGTYSSSYPTPTGIPSDPALAVYGVKQSQELASHLLALNPPIDKIYSSPFYRCIQTLSPFTDKLVEQKGEQNVRVVLEPGLGEFYGLARFDHPRPATMEVLNRHFGYLAVEPEPVIVPSTKGESIPQLHDRVAYCLHQIIRQADSDPKGPRALVICTHAASMICIGRALTGRMPEDEGEEDFRCFTCAFSKYVRKSTGSKDEVQAWDPQVPDSVPDVGWRGTGVAGGWECAVNGDCSFLSGGEERGWDFTIHAEAEAKYAAERAALAAKHHTDDIGAMQIDAEAAAMAAERVATAAQLSQGSEEPRLDLTKGLEQFLARDGEEVDGA